MRKCRNDDGAELERHEFNKKSKVRIAEANFMIDANVVGVPMGLYLAHDHQPIIQAKCL